MDYSREKVFIFRLKLILSTEIDSSQIVNQFLHHLSLIKLALLVPLPHWKIAIYLKPDKEFSRLIARKQYFFMNKFVNLFKTSLRRSVRTDELE